ncbi:MAG: ABC transporter substrate-binding protein [Alphaproteobacteria bacterium]
MTRFNRNVLALAAACGVAALAASAAAQTKILIGYTGANAFVPAFVAKDKGFFAKHGLDATLQRIPVGSTIPGALLANSLQVGTLTAPIFLAANENGIELTIIAGASLQAKSNPTAGVVARTDSGIKKPEDFKGKKVGAPGINGLQDLLFKKWLKNHNVDWRSVTYIDAPFPQMGDMIKGGQIDAALPVQPFVGRIIGTKVGYLVANYPVEVLDNYLESFYATSKKWAEANPAAVKGFRAAMTEAVDFVKTSPDEAKKTQTTYLGLPAEVVAALPLATYTVAVDVKQVAFWVELCREFGLLKTALKTDGLVAK